MEELSVVRGMVELSPMEEGQEAGVEWNRGGDDHQRLVLGAAPASQALPPSGSTASQRFNISFLIRKKKILV